MFIRLVREIHNSVIFQVFNNGLDRTTCGFCNDLRFFHGLVVLSSGGFLGSLFFGFLLLANFVHLPLVLLDLDRPREVDGGFAQFDQALEFSARIGWVFCVIKDETNSEFSFFICLKQVAWLR